MHFGRVSLLGEHDVFAPQLDGPLPVHRSVMNWLRAGRRGFVVLAKHQAWRVLEGIAITAEDLDHGLELQEQLTPPASTILVPQAGMKAAA